MFVRVQTTPKQSKGTSPSVTFTFTNLPQVGNAIVVPVTTWLSAGALSAGQLTDSEGNLGEVAVFSVGTGEPKTACAVYYIPRLTKVTAPYSVVLTFPEGSTPYSVSCALEVSGAGTYGLTPETIAIRASTVASTTPSVGPSAASAVAELFVVAVVGSSQAQTSITVEVPPISWAQEFEELPWTNTTGEADSRSLGSQVGVAQSCSWTFSTARNWIAVLAAFRAATGASVGRVTQEVVEVLSQPTPDLRVTQDVVEVLSLPTAAARVSQHVVETLVLVTADARLTQYAVETLTSLVVPVPPPGGGGGETSHPWFS